MIIINGQDCYGTLYIRSDAGEIAVFNSVVSKFKDCYAVAMPSQGYLDSYWFETQNIFSPNYRNDDLTIGVMLMNANAWRKFLVWPWH